MSRELRVPVLESLAALERRRLALLKKKKPKKRPKKRFRYSVGGRRARHVSAREYWAESLRAMRLNADHVLLFEVKWLDFPARDNTWQAPEDLSRCDQLFADLYGRQFAAEDRPQEFYGRADLVRFRRLLAHAHQDQKLLLQLSGHALQDFRRLKDHERRALLSRVQHLRAAIQKHLRRVQHVQEEDEWPTRLLALHVAQELHVLRDFGSLDAFFAAFEARAQLHKQLEAWARASGLPPEVHVTNLVDTSVPPEIHFLSDYHIDEALHARLRRTAGTWQCACEGDCARTQCVCALRLYSENRKYKTSNVVYECHALCTCRTDRCPNRRLARGSLVPLEIGRTRDKGWGLFARARVTRKTFVCEYLGHVVDGARARGDPQYFFALNAEFCGQTLFVDGTRLANATRFANHSCAPNLDVHLALRAPQDLVPRIAFFANRDIDSGEELTYDYRKAVLIEDQFGRFRARDDRSDSGYQSDDAGTHARRPTTHDDDQRFQCFCGAKSCRKFI